MADVVEPPQQWCIVANVVDVRPYGPGGQEARSGLRIFRAGAKLYVVDGLGGMGWETLEVVGRARSRSRFVEAKVRTEHLVNWRVKGVYSPALLDRINRIRGGLAGFWLRSSDFNDFGSQAYHDALAGVAAQLAILARQRRDLRAEGGS
ncbi:hypothetical protein [Kribbella ginsengisoli]|uniref:Uncharacterized protein n=1 Tax=Kribbella ginsengisoli TaxID=363865 RepID=A0ABP6Z787_9ACTN